MLVPKDIPLTAVKIRGSHISMLKSTKAKRADSARRFYTNSFCLVIEVLREE